MEHDFDPERPEKPLKKPAPSLDILHSLLRDSPKKEGFVLTPHSAAALAELFTAMARAMQKVEGLQFTARVDVKGESKAA